MSGLKKVALTIGETYRSTGSIVPSSTDNQISVDVEMANYSLDDNYTEAYKKRINYFVKDDTKGIVLVQGTMYVSKPTDYSMPSASHIIMLEEKVHEGSLLRLYLESPTGLGEATGSLTVYEEEETVILNDSDYYEIDSDIDLGPINDPDQYFPGLEDEIDDLYFDGSLGVGGKWRTKEYVNKGGHLLFNDRIKGPKDDIQNWMTYLAYNNQEKYPVPMTPRTKRATLYPGVKSFNRAVSSGKLMTEMYYQRLNITCYVHNWNFYDNFTEAYNKRFNYYVKHVKTGKILTQGTMYASGGTLKQHFRPYTSYSVNVPVNWLYEDLRVYVNSPTGKSQGHAQIKILAT